PDGEAALQALRKQKVDLVVTDVMMPRLDGFGLLRALRNDPVLKTTPVILLSARAGEEARLEGLHAGADSYLVKPFSARELRVHVEKDLAMARLRQEAAETIADVNSRLLAALEASETGTFRWNIRTDEVTWNESLHRLFGVARGHTVHSIHEFYSFVHPDDRPEVIRRLEQCRTQGTDYDVEYRIVQSTGSVRWLHARGRTFLAEDGTPAYMTGASVDVTARKRAEEAVRAANRELNDFATIVSHDLKSPLRGVATLAKWMQSDYADKLDEEGRENLADIVKRVSRMDRMIDGILQYSRLGRTDEKSESVALAELVSTVVEDLHPPEHVHIQVASGLPVLQGEPVRLRQLFQNLIANAIKYGDKPRTEIQVGWADAGGEWQFSVADNGPGIEQRHFERIFKMFQTLAPKDKTDSTGVGLALVKRIVDRAGGRVWVESCLGVGSTFYFTWPKRPKIEAAEALERMAA
ncbi:MAG TPA: ATP-binding protein, partial [Clostridia bacterium]|nr:ATP-binding protein [Clostridia bacterium]